jgi:hypothetical protein
MNEELKSRLVQMVEDVNRLEAELASDGSLYEDYPKRIRELHLNQALYQTQLTATPVSLVVRRKREKTQ